MSLVGLQLLPPPPFIRPPLQAPSRAPSHRAQGKGWPRKGPPPPSSALFLQQSASKSPPRAHQPLPRKERREQALRRGETPGPPDGDGGSAQAVPSSPAQPPLSWHCVLKPTPPHPETTPQATLR